MNIPTRIASLLLLSALALAAVACGGATTSTAAVIPAATSGVAASTTASSTTAVTDSAAPSTTSSVAAATSGQPSSSTPSETVPAAGPVEAEGESISVGLEAQVGDWKVEVVSVTWNADSVVANHNEFNDPPEEGSRYVMVKLQAVRTGEGAGSFSGDVYCTFLGSDGILFDTAPQDIPEAIREADPVEHDSTVTGQVVFQVSSDQVSGGRLVMEAASSSAGSRVVFVLE